MNAFRRLWPGEKNNQKLPVIIQANFSVDHRAIILLTNCLFLSIRGQAWSSLSIFQVFVTCIFAVARQSCGPPPV